MLLPNVVHGVFCVWHKDFADVGIYFFRLCVGVENGKIFAIFALRRPNYITLVVFLFSLNALRICCLSVHLHIVAVGEERKSEFVIFGHISAYEQRTAENSPK